MSKTRSAIGQYLFHDLAAAHRKLHVGVNDDPINVQFTSGTTGSPKGATLTHYNIVNNARFVTDRIRFSEADRLCIPVPLYHCFGMVMGSLGCVTQGAAMVLPGGGFDAAQTLHAVSEARCTALYGVPTMFVAITPIWRSRSWTAMEPSCPSASPESCAPAAIR